MASTGKSLMVLKAQLDRVVAAGDQLHTQAFDSRERGPQEFTVFEEIPVFIKVRLSERTPPLTLRFTLKDKKQQIEVFYSATVKEPCEANHHGHSMRVSGALGPNLYFSPTRLCFTGREAAGKAGLVTSGSTSL